MAWRPGHDNPDIGQHRHGEEGYGQELFTGIENAFGWMFNKGAQIIQKVDQTKRAYDPIYNQVQKLTTDKAVQGLAIGAQKVLENPDVQKTLQILDQTQQSVTKFAQDFTAVDGKGLGAKPAAFLADTVIEGASGLVPLGAVNRVARVGPKAVKKGLSIVDNVPTPKVKPKPTPKPPKVVGTGSYGTVVEGKPGQVVKHINPQRTTTRAAMEEVDSLARNPNSPNVHYVDIDPMLSGDKRVSIAMDDARVNNKSITNRGVDDKQPVSDLAFSDKASDKTIALRQAQESVKQILKGELVLDRHVGNVMVNKMTGRPYQLDVGVTAKLRDKAAKAQELSYALSEGFSAVGDFDTASVLTDTIWDYIAGGQYDEAFDLAQQGVSKLMKIKRVSKTPISTVKPKTPSVPLGPQRPRLERRGANELGDQPMNPNQIGVPPEVTAINKRIKAAKESGLKKNDPFIKELLQEKKEIKQRLAEKPKPKTFNERMKEARAEQKTRDAKRFKVDDPKAPWNQDLPFGAKQKYAKRRENIENAANLSGLSDAQKGRVGQLYQQSSIKNQRREQAWKDGIRSADAKKGNLNEQLSIAAEVEGRIEAHHINPRAKTYQLTKNLTDEQHYWVHNELEKRGVGIGNDPAQGVQLTKRAEHLGSPDTVHGKYKDLLIDGSLSPEEILTDKQTKRLVDFYDSVASGDISNPQDIVDIITMYDKEYRRIVKEVTDKRSQRWPDLDMTKRAGPAKPVKKPNPLRRPTK